MKTTVLVLMAVSAISLAQDAPRKISLADAIALAEKNSPVLKSAIAEVGASKAGANAARAQTMPQLSANGFATTGNKQSTLSSSPMVVPSALMMTPPGSFLAGNLMLMVPILDPIDAARASVAGWQAKSASHELSEARAELDLQVTDAYDRVLLARQLVRAEEAKLTSSAELVRTTRALFEAGKGIEATVQRTQAELSRAQRALTSARNEEAKALLDLQATIGLDFGEGIDPSGELETRSAPGAVGEFVERGKQKRGMLLAARAKVQAAKAEVRATEGQAAPQLYGVAMGDAENRRGMGGITAGLTLSFPLFDGGRIRAETSRARSMRTKAEAEVRTVELTVEKEIRQAYLDVQTGLANAESARASVVAAQSAYDVTALRVQAGKSILIEQLDALEALTRARSDLAQALFDQAVAAARLDRAAGGIR